MNRKARIRWKNLIRKTSFWWINFAFLSSLNCIRTDRVWFIRASNEILLRGNSLVVSWILQAWVGGGYEICCWFLCLKSTNLKLRIQLRTLSPWPAKSVFGCKIFMLISQLEHLSKVYERFVYPKSHPLNAHFHSGIVLKRFRYLQYWYIGLAMDSILFNWK